MTWTEMINIRAHSSLDAEQIVSTFYQLSAPGHEKNLADIAFLRNQGVVNDFCIRLTWQGEMNEGAKSALGFHLAEAFSKMGMINHSIWIRETSLFLMNRRRVNDKQ